MALRFFFTHTVDRPDLARKLVRLAHPRKLPVVLSRDEVARLLNADTMLFMVGTGSAGPSGATQPGKPRRFYGSVEIDMVRPVKSFDSILNAVVMELQRTHGAKVKLTLEIEAEASDGFADSEVSVVRDNAKQLKFKADSTGFDE